MSGANTYTGGTTINAGTLTVGNDSALGTGDVTMAAGTTLGFASGDYTIANNIAMTGDPTFFVDTGNTDTLAGVLSDTTPGPGTAGVVEKTGDGTLILTGVNTYTGGTIFNAGSCRCPPTAGLGDTSGGLTFDGGTLQWGAAFDSARAITLGSGGGIFDTNSYNSTLSGVISGSGALVKKGWGTLTLSGANTYTGATRVDYGTLALSGSLASSQITIATSGEMDYLGASTAGSAAITDNHFLNFNDSSTAGNATINIAAGYISGGIPINQGTASFNDTSTAGSATITNGGNLYFKSSSTAGSSTITNNDSVTFVDTSAAGSATINNAQILIFRDSSTAGSATITNDSGLLAFFNSSTAGNATITTNSGSFTVFNQTASGGSASFIVNGTGALDISGLANGGTTAGSIAGDGDVFLGGNNLAVGGNNLDTTFSGVIQDGAFGGGGATGGSLTKEGAGNLTLSGANTYTGGTTIDAGTITVGNDSALGTGDVTMAAGTTLGFASGDFTIANNIAMTGDPIFFVDTGNTDTLSGVLSDTTPGPGTAGVVEKTGDGTLILTGANTYTGGTIFNAGILQVSADNGLGASSGGLTFGGGTLQWGAAFDSARAITLNSGGGSFDSNGYDSTLSGVISGTGALTKTGSGTLTLSGANTYTGATTVNGGILALSGSLASGQITIGTSGEMDYLGTSTAGSATITTSQTAHPWTSFGHQHGR